MVTVVTLVAISAATTAARPDDCCDSVATPPSGRRIVDANPLTDRDIHAYSKQARLQQYEANDQYLRRQPADAGDRGLTARGCRRDLLLSRNTP
jgi:hypothetical protein